MGLLTWIIVGLLAGWIASMVMKTDSQQGMLADIVIGMIGAVIGGFVMNALGASSADGFNIYSILVATLGSIILIGLKRMLTNRSAI